MKFEVVKNDFKNYLNGIILGGIVKEAVVNFGVDKVSIKCIDPNNIMFSFVEFDCKGEKEIKVGVKDIQLLGRVADLLEGDNLIFDYDDNKYLVFGKNKIKILTLSPLEISTYFDNEEKLDKLLDSYDVNVDIHTSKFKKLKEYLTIFSPELLKFSISKGVLHISSYNSEYNKFNLDISKIDFKEEFELVINAKYFESILNYIFEVNLLESVVFKFNCEKTIPLFVDFGGVKWLLSPM